MAIRDAYRVGAYAYGAGVSEIEFIWSAMRVTPALRRASMAAMMAPCGTVGSASITMRPSAPAALAAAWARVARSAAVGEVLVTGGVPGKG